MTTLAASFQKTFLRMRGIIMWGEYIIRVMGLNRGQAESRKIAKTKYKMCYIFAVSGRKVFTKGLNLFIGPVQEDYVF